MFTLANFCPLPNQDNGIDLQKKSQMPQRLITLMNWSSDHYWNFVTGIFFAFISYFAELKGAFHVMFVAFLLDLCLGILASKTARKERFSMRKLFIAFERMVIAYALVMLLYAMDREMKQDTFSLANISAWLVTGFLAYSAAENGYEVTGGKLFLTIKSLIRKKVQDNTGIDMDETNQQPDEKA
ncbi:MAG: phage holin family protein [Bacteroidales bacterium]